MPKKAAEMSALSVGRLTEPGLHFVGGVAGLALQVLATGGRSWILRTSIAGKRREMGLGGFPDVTLAGAREAAREARAKIDSGIDPIKHRIAARNQLHAARANAVTFETAALSFIKKEEPSWKNEKHGQQWRNTLATYAYPVIGSMLVSDIELRHVLEVLEPIWHTKTETATRVRSRIESVLGWATTKGYREGLNPARWKDHLSNVLAQPAKISKERHHPALPVPLVGSFIQELREQNSSGARALGFCTLTAVRSMETRGAVWSEIDFEKAEWNIPAVRMKMKRDHKVPLSPRAIEILKQQPRMANTDLVFPAAKGKQISESTLNAVIKRMNEREMVWVDPTDGRQAVTHGFRSTFRDWAAERTNFPREVAEMALAHGIGDKVEAAYRRGELLEKRRAMMADWEQFLSVPEASAKVIPLRQSKQA